MGKVGGRPMGSFDQGGGREVVGIETAGSRRWRHVRRSYVRGFWVREREGSIVWLGDSRWGGNGGVRRLWWEETGVAVRHGRGARDGGLKTLASRHSCHTWWPYVRVFGSRAGGLNRVIGVKAAGKVVAAVRCGGGGEIRGQGWCVGHEPRM